MIPEVKEYIQNYEIDSNLDEVVDRLRRLKQFLLLLSKQADLDLCQTSITLDYEQASMYTDCIALASKLTTDLEELVDTKIDRYLSPHRNP